MRERGFGVGKATGQKSSNRFVRDPKAFNRDRGQIRLGIDLHARTSSQFLATRFPRARTNRIAIKSGATGSGKMGFGGSHFNATEPRTLNSLG
jgi:hypothetical protein